MTRPTISFHHHGPLVPAPDPVLAAFVSGTARSIFLTQAEGTLPDGRGFYFRAKHGAWDLEIAPASPLGPPPARADWDRDGEIIAEGEVTDWPRVVTDEEILAILRSACEPR
jgi:hypothetical protein